MAENGQKRTKREVLSHPRCCNNVTKTQLFIDCDGSPYSIRQSSIPYDSFAL
jgi:hypothetical protein